MQQNPQILTRKSNAQSYCTKHNQYFDTHEHVHNDSNDSSLFSIDQQYLKKQTPLQIQIQPEIQIQVKPHIDILISTNLKMNKYKHTYQKIEKQQERIFRDQQLKKLNQSAKQALLKSKTRSQQSHNKWGHSIYQNTHKDIPQQQPKPTKNQQSPKSKNKNLQNATEKAKQRIIEFQQKLLEKQKQQQKNESELKEKKLDKKKLEQVKAKITQNAEQILKQKQAEIEEAKKKRQEIKRKIQQLQKQSLKNCKRSKQNPLKFQSGKQEQFHLQQSQYSTFQARKQGRKMVKKEKKKRNFKQDNETKLVAEISSRRNLRQKLNKTVPNFNKPKKFQKQKQNINNQQQQKQPDTKKQFNRFYVWNVPIQHQDYSLVVLNNRLSEENKSSIEKSKPQEKSFKQQAEEYLKQKEAMELQARKEKSRQVLLLQRIAEKKEMLMKQYQGIYMKNIIN